MTEREKQERGKRKAGEAVRGPLDYEEQLTLLVSHLMTSKASELDEKVSCCLKILGEYSTADRCSILQFSDNNRDTLDETHEWCAAEARSYRDSLQNLAGEGFSWTMETLRQFKPVQIPSVEDLPAVASVERKFFQSMNIKSSLMVPMISGEALSGILWLSTVRTEIPWSEEFLPFLEKTAVLFVNALERNHMYEAFERNARELKIMFDATPVPQLVVDRNLRIHRANIAAQQYSGQSELSITGKKICDVIRCHASIETVSECAHGDKCRGCAVRIAIHGTFEIREGGGGIEASVLVCDGPDLVPKIFNLNTAYLKNRGESRVIISLEDMTDRRNLEKELGGSERKYQALNSSQKLTERALRESEEKYRFVVENSCDVITSYSPEGIVEFASPQVSRYGYTPDEIVGHHISEFIHPDDVENALTTFEELHKTGAETPASFRLLKKDGTHAYVEVNGAIVREGGRIVRSVGTIRDITDRKQAEDERRREGEKAQKYLDLAGAMIIALDTAGKITLINDKGCEILGGAREEIIGENWFRRFVPERMREEVMSVFRSLMAGELEPVEYHENPIVTVDGEEKILSWHNSIVTDESGAITGILSSGTDNTERLQGENDLRESRENYRLLVENQADLVVKVDTRGKVLFASPSYCEFFEKKQDEFLGSTFTPLVHEEDGESTAKEMESLFKPPYSCYVEQRVTTKDGLRWLAWSDKAVLDEDDNVVAIVGVGRDITTVKMALEELNRQNVLLDEIFTNVKEGIGIVDTEERIEFCNPAFADIMDSDVVSILGRNIKDFFDVEEQHVLDQQTSEGQKGTSSSYELPCTTARGNKKYIRVTVSPRTDEQGVYIGAFGVILDITDRKKTEDELQESERRLKTVFEGAAEGILGADTDTKKFLFANPTICEMLGYSGEEIKNLSVSDIHPADALDLVMSEFEAQMKGEKILASGLPCRRKDGSVFYADVKATVTWMDGRECNLGFFTDITERKETEDQLRKYRSHLEEMVELRTRELKASNESLQTEITEKINVAKELRKSEERYRVLVESAADVIVTLSREGELLSVNRTGTAVLGKTRQEIVGKNVRDVFPPEEVEGQLKGIRHVFETKQPLREFESLVRTVSGDRWYSMTISPITDADGSVAFVLGIARDVTEKKQIDEELQKSSKLESVGLLAGGIAHDFNNILTALFSNLGAAKLMAEPGKKLYNIIVEAEKASSRAKGLTQQLLTFSKGGAPVKKTVNMGELIRSSIDFVMSGSSVRCEHFVAEDLWPADVDEGQINQVINNLVINAVQAMPEGGTIEVRAENRIVAGDRNLPLQEGRYLSLSIQDHGTGISKEAQQKIFDPYFTTKEKGSGLGLTSSYSIVKQHKGYIEVESEEGVGSTFRVYLPAAEESPALPEKSSKKPIDRGGRIILMDDDGSIRDSVGELIRFLGYEVALARDGSEAIELYRKASGTERPFDALIMDLTVPGGMGGTEAIKKLLEIDPGVKAIVSSGYSNDPVMSDFRKYGFRGVVAKPYNVDELNTALHKIIHDGQD